MTCDEDREVLGSQPSALAIEDLRSGDPWPGGRHLAPPVPPDRSAKSLKSHERLPGSRLAVTRKRDGTGHHGAGRHRRAHPTHQLPQGVPGARHPGVAQAWWYCLALAQQATGVAVHQSTLVINHHHTEVTGTKSTDPPG